MPNLHDGDDIYADWTVDFATGEPVVNRRYLAGASFTDLPLPQAGPAYFHADHLGTTRRLTQDGGSPPVRASIYTAFGELKHSAGSLTTRYGYVGASGYEESPAGGPADLEFVHVGARWYDPATGRFLQRDPIGIEGGLNLYIYAHGDPASFSDADGHQEGPVEIPVGEPKGPGYPRPYPERSHMIYRSWPRPPCVPWYRRAFSITPRAAGAVGLTFTTSYAAGRGLDRLVGWGTGQSLSERAGYGLWRWFGEDAPPGYDPRGKARRGR